jgi:uncharacterized protein
MNSAGGRFSVNKFYNTLKSMSIRCTKNSLYEYLDHLMDAYVFFKVPIHSRSEKSRMINPVKMYSIDTGLLNAMIFRNSMNSGMLFENLVFLKLRRDGYDIEYVIARDGFETDFLARHRGTGKQKLIQVCWDMSNQKTFEREVRGLARAMVELSIQDGTIVTWDSEAVFDSITAVPIWKWLLHE